MYPLTVYLYGHSPFLSWCMEIGPSASSKSIPTLGPAILHVVVLRTQKQMIRVAASPVIATMQNGQSGGYLSTMNNPRYARTSMVFPLRSEACIPIRIERSKPFPAQRRARRPSGVFFKTLCDGLTLWHGAYDFPSSLISERSASSGSEDRHSTSSMLSQPF